MRLKGAGRYPCGQKLLFISATLTRVSGEETSVSVTESTQIKENKIKENKRKEYKRRVCKHPHPKTPVNSVLQIIRNRVISYTLKKSMPLITLFIDRNNYITFFGNTGCLKVSLFVRYPLIKEAIRHIGVSL